MIPVYGRVNSMGTKVNAKLREMTFTPDEFPYVKYANTYGVDGFREIHVNAPDNFSAENIKKDVTIAGVTGTYEGTTTPSTLGTADIKPTAFPTVKNASDDGVDGYSTVTVQAPDNLTAENIKSGVSIAGVTGTYEGSGGGSDPEAEFFKALVTTNGPSHPANAPAGLIKSNTLAHWPEHVYVGPDGVDLSSINTLSGAISLNVESLFQFHSMHILEEAGGPIKFGNIPINMSNSALMGLPEGEWTLYVGSFGSCKFTTDIVITEAHVPGGVIPGSSLSNIAKFPLGSISTLTPLTLTLPANITEIQAYSVSGTSSAKLNLVMLATTPPTLSSTRSIQNVASITVPAGTLEAYQTATNWSTLADIMVEATTEAGA